MNTQPEKREGALERSVTQDTGGGERAPPTPYDFMAEEGGHNRSFHVPQGALCDELYDSGDGLYRISSEWFRLRWTTDEERADEEWLSMVFGDFEEFDTSVLPIPARATDRGAHLYISLEKVGEPAVSSPTGDRERGTASMLAEFHRVFAHPADTDELRRSVRLVLHREEHEELVEALESGDRAAIARELADNEYVNYGTARVYGIDLDAAVAEVHRANMSKLGADGRPIQREDGKILKGPNFRPPDMTAALAGPPAPSSGDREREALGFLHAAQTHISNRDLDPGLGMLGAAVDVLEGRVPAVAPPSPSPTGRYDALEVAALLSAVNNVLEWIAHNPPDMDGDQQEALWSLLDRWELIEGMKHDSRAELLDGRYEDSEPVEPSPTGGERNEPGAGLIYVQVVGVKPSGAVAGGNQWHRTGDVAEAVAREMAAFRSMWNAVEGDVEPITYRITVAPEASPRRTTRGAPLPVQTQPTGGEAAGSYWQTDEGRLSEAIRQGLRDAGVHGTLAEFVGPIIRRIAALSTPAPSDGREAREGLVIRADLATIGRALSTLSTIETGNSLDLVRVVAANALLSLTRVREVLSDTDGGAS